MTDPNMQLRMVSIGVCSTLGRAAAMGVPGADDMRDLLRQAVDDALKPKQEPTQNIDKDTDRHFQRVLFCGAGKHTTAQIEVLHGRINAALVYLGGRQQGPHWRDQPSQEMLDQEKRQNDEADLVCEQVARDVAMALTGKEITFAEST